MSPVKTQIRTDGDPANQVLVLTKDGVEMTLTPQECVEVARRVTALLPLRVKASLAADLTAYVARRLS